MDAETLVVELYQALEKAGVRNRVQRVRQIARELGASFTNDDATRWLQPYVDNEWALRGQGGKFRGRKRGTVTDGSRTDIHEGNGRKPDGKRTERRTDARPRGSQVNSKIVPIVEDLSLLASLGVASGNPPPRTLSDFRNEVEARVRSLASRELRSLDHKEMFDVAALHALRFMAHKAPDEKSARKAAVGLAGRIRNVVSAKDHPAMHTLTVQEYFAFGREVWEAGGKQTWDVPWAVVTWAEAPERQA